MNSILRPALVLSLAAAALAASAQTTYSLIDPARGLNAIILAAAPATSTANSTTDYVPPAVTGTYAGTAITQASLAVSGTGKTFGFFVAGTGGSSISVSTAAFPIALLTQSGTSTAFGEFTFTSVVGPVQPTPEPSALAALGLGAVAMLKRRKRA